ncbi:MAG: amidohydrolase family protein, partial [Pseudomonadota bacterium]
MKVDVHAHCYPEPYVKELKKYGAGDDGGIATKIPVWAGEDETIALMDAVGIDVLVLNLSAPNVYHDDPELSKALARMSNDFMAEVCRRHPDRFLSLASVPLNHMPYALDELARAIDVLKMDGVLLGTNINRKPLSNDEFLPFFEELNRRRIPVGLHPIKAIGEELMPPEYLQLAMAPSVGFIFETTRTMAQMTYKGLFEK